uniref:Uncharacterized protein n=1 Tax=Pseudo-nitzschia australis TaxID=44445 RepID=A0A7S4ASV6_9STRA
MNPERRAAAAQLKNKPWLREIPLQLLLSIPIFTGGASSASPSNAMDGARSASGASTASATTWLGGKIATTMRFLEREGHRRQNEFKNRVARLQLQLNATKSNITSWIFTYGATNTITRKNGGIYLPWLRIQGMGGRF